MAFGVENRCPFLDHRLVKLVAALPARFKIRGGTTKWLLRRIARGRVPTAISERRSKMGFPTPVGVWLRGPLAGHAKQWLESYGANTTFARWIELSAASRLLAEHIAGRGEHQAALWRILAVGAWATGAGW
jgi:asparagine synthase (glutamine-hydrolysing)